MGSSPRWRPDGRALVFLREDGPARVWLSQADDPDSSAPLSPEGLPVAEHAWSPDGRMLALIEAVELGHPGALWIVDANSGDARRTTELPAHEIPGNLSWSPDGTSLAWDVMTFSEGRTNNAFEVRLLDVADRSLRCVVPVGSCQTGASAWSPDGTKLAFRATPHPYGYQALFRLATWHVEGGATHYLIRDPLSAYGPAWSPDGERIYFLGRGGGITRQLYSVSAGGGDLRRLTDMLARHSSLDVSPDGRWLLCDVESPDHLTEVWLIASDGSESRCLTGASRKLTTVEGLRLGVPELLRWRSADGLELEGLLIWPPGYGPGRRPERPLPTVVDVHDGPTNQTVELGLGGHPLYLDGLHYLAAHGYLCFSADYRRSGCYGWEHIGRAIERGDFVGMDAVDILSAVDLLVSRGWADPAALGIRGFSHGGFLANWLLTQTGRFQAVVSIEGMTNHMTRPMPDTILEVWMGGKPEEVPERYRQYSPLTYAAQAASPTLLVYGEEGVFNKTHQGQDFRDALVSAGVEAELLVLPGEDHFFEQPQNLELFLVRSLAWYDGHLRDGERGDGG